MVSPNKLRLYVSRYLKTYDSNYSIDNIRNIVASRRMFSYMPFNKLGGVIIPPNTNYAIFYTDAPDISEWQAEHAEYLLAEIHNEDVYDHANINTGSIGGPRKRGRPSVEQAQEIKAQQYEMSKYVMEQTELGKSGRTIARELNITPSRVSQLKKRWLADYFVDMA